MKGKPVVVSPIALEAVKKIDAIFVHERAISGRPAEERLAYRKEHVAALVADLEAWMRAERTKFSRHADPAKAMDYMLKRWDAFSPGEEGEGSVAFTEFGIENLRQLIADSQT